MENNLQRPPPKVHPNPRAVIPQGKHVETTAEMTKPSSTGSFKDIETVALVVNQAKEDFKLVPIILDEVRPDEFLVEMHYSGICHTDLVAQQGLLPMVEFPAIFGHEGAGIIRAIGSDVRDKTLKIGDAVLLSFNTCGACRACRTKHPGLCHPHAAVNFNGVRLSDRSTPARLRGGDGDGTAVRGQYFGQSSFSRMSVVSEKCVVRCAHPEQMHVYAPMGCGFQTGAGTVLNVLRPAREQSLVVFGLGSVGLASVMAAKYLEVGQIVGVDIVEERLSLARELGATHAINSRRAVDVARAIREVTDGGASFAVDCTGVLEVIEDMIECLGPQGTAALVGAPPSDSRVKLDPLMFLIGNKKLVGVIEGDSNPSEFIPRLVDMHRAGHFPIDKLCKTYPISRFQEAIHDMHAGRVSICVVKFR
ncbi:GroES-like protein [Xylariomycetidae sp. FL2044]|nr:GroES-like protein [Xylariomycetidae sp. FL2044]